MHSPQLTQNDTGCNVIWNTDDDYDCFLTGYAYEHTITACVNISAYLCVLQCLVYMCTPYGYDLY